MISLTHLKLIKCLYTLLDQGAQISFSLLSLNAAHDVAQGTGVWNTHLLTTAIKCEIFHIYSQKSPSENYIRTTDCSSIWFSKWQIKKLILQLNITLARTLLESDAIIGFRWSLGSTPEPVRKLPTVKLYYVALIGLLPKNARLRAIIVTSYSTYALPWLLLIHFTACRLSTLKHLCEDPLSITGKPCYFTEHLHSNFENQ